MDEILELAKQAESSCVLAPPEFSSNPYIKYSSRGARKDAEVPAVLWWLEHPNMKLSHIRYNEMEDTITAELLPWNPEPHTWTEADSAFLFNELQRMTDDGVKSRQNLSDALLILAHKHKYNPLLDVLESLPQWDGKPRASTLLVDFLGAADTAYVREVTLHLLNGAIERIYRPGIKFDECVTLVSSRQGIGKSTLCSKLALRDEFFTDTLGDVSSKDAPENMRGKWIVELSELEGLRKKEVETIKNFLSKRVDRYRASYAKLSIDRPRKCIFIGTTNSMSFLSDKTGNRRFLPILCDVQKPTLNIFDDDAGDYIAQVWSEVLFERNLNGSRALVLPTEIKKAAAEACDAFAVDDPNTGVISAWVKRKCKPGELVCIMQLMTEAFDMPRNEAAKNRILQREISQTLDLSPEFERLNGRHQHSDLFGKQRCWKYVPQVTTVTTSADSGQASDQH